MVSRKNRSVGTCVEQFFARPALCIAICLGFSGLSVHAESVTANEKAVTTSQSAGIDFKKEGCAPKLPKLADGDEVPEVTTLAVTIAKDGAITKVSIVKSSGNRSFDQLIYKKLKSGTCIASPNIMNGEAQVSSLNADYVWKLK